MTIEEKEQEIIDEFSIYDDWMDKYAYLIELGSGLEGMDEAHKTEENLIKGCSRGCGFMPICRMAFCILQLTAMQLSPKASPDC